MRLRIIAAALLCAVQAEGQGRASDVVYEATIDDLQRMMASSQATSASLVEAYLARIAAYDQRGPALNAIIRLNPNARAEAVERDRERRAGHVRGPLHGIPILLKDNYNTANLPTTGGSIALAGFTPPRDAYQVTKLRKAGAVILGKTNLHELAAGITSISSMGGQTCNPYDPRRNPGGSSGGTGAAVAASFAAIGWGSDTCGSIRLPAASNNLFGLRPTKGLSSIAGIIPLSHTQDVAGPLARTVRDLAIGLDATVGADAADPATRMLDTVRLVSFVSSLDTTALRGARIGVLTAHFGGQPEDQEVTTIVRAALERLKAQGAEVVDVAIPGLDSVIANAGLIDFEFKFDLMDYFAANPGAPVSSLSDILKLGLYHSALETTFRRRDTRTERESPEYRAALTLRVAARSMVVKLLDENRLDAIVYPTVRRKPAPIGEVQRGLNCQLSAVTGLPAMAMPAGFTVDSLPIGMELLGRPMADVRLVSLAYDYEQAVKPRRAPRMTPALVGGPPAAATLSGTIATSALHASVVLRLPRGADIASYAVSVSGIVPSRLYAVSLTRDSSGRAGPVVARLSGAAVRRATGTVALSEADRGALAGGRLFLSAYTADDPRRPVSARITPRPMR